MTDQSFSKILQRSYAAFRNKVAVQDTDEMLTYGKLGAAAWALAADLRARGVRRGDHAVVIMRNSAPAVVVEHALMLSGVVRVGLATRLSPAEVAHVVSDCTAAVLIVDEEWSVRLPEVAELCDSGLPDVILSAPLERPLERAASADGLPENPPAALRDIVDDPPGGSECALILYTSGTTGRAKGVVLSHNVFVAMIEGLLVAVPGLARGGVVGHCLPLPHATGMILAASVTMGGTQLLFDSARPEALLDSIEAYRCSVVTMVPTVIQSVAEEQARQPRDVSSLQAIPYTGAPITPSALDSAIRILGPVFVQYYAQSEALPPLTLLSQEDHAQALQDPRILSSAGRVFPFVDMRIADDAGAECRPGDVGEVWVRASTATSGYLNMLEATENLFAGEGWLRTGDLGYIDARGYLYLVDRLKEVIISGGFNVYPAEVEAALSQVPWVREVAVFGVPDDRWGEAVAVAFSLKGHDGVPQDLASASQELEACSRRQLADYKTPRKFFRMNELPKNANGKIDKRKLRESHWSEMGRMI
ncbi:class I adenylate-forming enzyme family protein [Georgenia sp. 10Sc9-8]|uniref:Class I adenylate-forming enzyme family protein n=1 Tax=Georgenia halotolerans TaxID=3028317 RepID=A0ABT5TXX2_9MICO|nr:class I adenylate-forming enzyme family protein [Georgenia halotolerans]